MTDDTPLIDLPCHGQNQTPCSVVVDDTSVVGKEFSSLSVGRLKCSFECLRIHLYFPIHVHDYHIIPQRKEK